MADQWVEYSKVVASNEGKKTAELGPEIISFGYKNICSQEPVSIWIGYIFISCEWLIDWQFYDQTMTTAAVMLNIKKTLETRPVLFQKL